MASGSATLAYHVIATRENCMNKLLLGVVLNQSLFPTSPYGLVEPFYSVEPEGLWHLIRTLGRQLR
jgi:hypothetical protein